MSGTFPARVVRLLEQRSDGACEGCGRWGVPLEKHHRKFKSRGGEHTVENGVMLCGWGNHTGCHGRAHSANPPEGWAVHRWENPADLPFTDLNGRTWLFRPDGTKVPAEVQEHR